MRMEIEINNPLSQKSILPALHCKGDTTHLERKTPQNIGRCFFSEIQQWKIGA